MKKTILEKINYEDKENFKDLPTIPIFQKASAEDFNLIKKIVNSSIEELNTNISPEILNLINSTVKIIGDQFIDGIKTFTNEGSAITFSSVDKIQQLEFKNNDVSILTFGKLSNLNNDISISTKKGSLIISANEGIIFKNEISGISIPLKTDAPTPKIYVDEIKTELIDSINSIEIILNDLISQIDNLTPFVFRGEYNPTISYDTADLVENETDFLYLSLSDNNLNNPLSDKTFWKNFGPTIDLSDYYNKIQIDQKLNLKANQTEIDAIDAKLKINISNITKNADDILLKANQTSLNEKQDKLTAGANISILDNIISSTGGGGGGDVSLDTDQTITGIKTFTNGIKNNLVEVDGKSLIMKNSAAGSNYLEIEQTYTTGYKNWFGVLFFRTTGTSRAELSSIQVRQDDALYINTGSDLVFNAVNIKFNNARLQQVGAPTADYDAATKKYVDDGLNLKSNETEITAIDAKLAINISNITKNADDILLKANQTEIDAIDAKLAINISNITKNANDILLKANQTEIDAIDAKLAINISNITKNANDILLKANQTSLNEKQDKLTAGANISILDNIISSTGGVSLDTNQNITGIKTFTNGINNNFIEVNGKSLIIKNSNTAASYLEVESVYSGSGYKNWFGIQLFRTTGTSRSRLANLEIRQDDGLYIACANDVSIQGANIKFNNARLQQVGAPTADYDAATKKYVDERIVKLEKTLAIFEKRFGKES